MLLVRIACFCQGFVQNELPGPDVEPVAAVEAPLRTWGQDQVELTRRMTVIRIADPGSEQ